MAGDIKLKYGTTQALTQTNLDGLASSTSFTAGWTSGSIDNTSALAVDYLISGQFQAESSGLTAGEIRVSVYGIQDSAGPTWPDLFSSGTEGTEGAATISDTEVRDSAFAPLWVTVTDTTASRVYPMISRSIKEAVGNVPPLFALFVAQSTVAALETTGDPNKLYYTPILYQYT